MNNSAAPDGRALAPAEATPTAVDAQRLQALCARAVEHEELRPLLELLRRLLNAQALAWLEAPSHGSRRPDAVVSARPGAGAALVALRGSLDPRRAVVGGGPEIFTLSAPVIYEGEHRGWLTAQLAVRQARDLQALLVLLQMAAGYVVYHEQRQATAAVGQVLERASGLIELFRAAGSELDFELACRCAADALREELGCRRVSLGYRTWGRWRLQAISGLARVDGKSAAHQPVEAAMKEAAGSGHPIDWTLDAPSRPETSAHELLGQQTGAARLLTLPLPRKSGALLLEWGSAEEGAPGARDPRVAAAAAAFVPVLFDLLHRARPNATLYSAHHWWNALSRRRRRFYLALGVGAAALLACPFPYTLRADCRLAPVVKRVVAAPFQGELHRTLVRPGDHVKEGDVLGELENRELKMKEAELLAARERALKQRDRAMANHGEGTDFAAAQVANFEAQSVAEDLALVQRKLSLLEVRSPIAGTVVSGDLRRAEGQPLQQGQVLWEIAPLEEMVAELEVPDREVSRVRAGQAVSVRLDAFATGSWKGSLERVHPQSEPVEGRNVFICDVTLRQSDSGAELRPGMRGRAAISAGHRPLIWIVGHRFREWLVTTLFW